MFKIVNGEQVELTPEEIDEFNVREQADDEFRNSLEYRQWLAVSQRLYPSIGDQLDMIYKDMKNGTFNWVCVIDKIKAAHPKPTE